METTRLELGKIATGRFCNERKALLPSHLAGQNSFVVTTTFQMDHLLCLTLATPFLVLQGISVKKTFAIL